MYGEKHKFYVVKKHMLTSCLLSLVSSFRNTNIIFFRGNWFKERASNQKEIKISSLVVHSLEVASTEEKVLTYEDKDLAFMKRGSCAEVLKYWEKEKIGAHYIITSESTEKVLTDIETQFSDLKERKKDNRFGSVVHNLKDIALICCVPDYQAAFHAGKSHFKNFGIVDGARCTLNFDSIGIEVQGNGYYKGNKTVQNFDRFWTQQITMLVQLVQFLCKKHALDAKESVVAHSTIAPLRKKDPGRYFPFAKIAEKGIGWILPKLEEASIEDISTSKVRDLLMNVGYGLSKDVYFGVEAPDEEQAFGCITEKSGNDAVFSTLDGWALQYAPWAWEQEPEGAKCLSQASRRQVAQMLRRYLKL